MSGNHEQIEDRYLKSLERGHNVEEEIQSRIKELVKRNGAEIRTKNRYGIRRK